MAHITHTHTHRRIKMLQMKLKKEKIEMGKKGAKEWDKKNQHCNLQFAIIKFSMWKLSGKNEKEMNEWNKWIRQHCWSIEEKYI